MKKPWEGEPDHEEFSVLGFPCCIMRVPEVGTLCGYLYVPRGHPWFEKGYNSIDCEVHGGLTYSERAVASETRHDPKTAVDNGMWALGFDCAHCFDLMPFMTEKFKDGSRGTYKTIKYVRDECTKLAKQVYKIGSPKIKSKPKKRRPARFIVKRIKD